MTNKPKRIQRKRTPGWKMPPNTVYVGRPTKWGNPYEVGKCYPILCFELRTVQHRGLYPGLELQEPGIFEKSQKSITNQQIEL